MYSRESSALLENLILNNYGKFLRQKECIYTMYSRESSALLENLILVPGLRSEGAGGFSSGGAVAPSLEPVDWSPVLPTDLLVSPSPSVAACCSGLSMSGHSWLSWLLSPPASSNCSSLAPVNLAVAMPLGQCELLPQRGVVLVFVICNETKRPY